MLIGIGQGLIGCGKLLESDEVATNYGAPHRDDGVRYHGLMSKMSGGTSCKQRDRDAH